MPSQHRKYPEVEGKTSRSWESDGPKVSCLDLQFWIYDVYIFEYLYLQTYVLFPLLINQPCWKRYLVLTPPGRSTHWIFSSWWMQVCRGTDWWGLYSLDQFGRMVQRFSDWKIPSCFFWVGDGWNRNLSGEKSMFCEKVGIFLKTWRWFKVLRVLSVVFNEFLCIFYQDFAEVGEIFFNLTRLIIWMVRVCNMMKLFDVRLPF